jgi:hypothetical protein
MMGAGVPVLLVKERRKRGRKIIFYFALLGFENEALQETKVLNQLAGKRGLRRPKASVLFLASRASFQTGAR